jgi:hypothetical protein
VHPVELRTRHIGGSIHDESVDAGRAHFSNVRALQVVILRDLARARSRHKYRLVQAQRQLRQIEAEQERHGT